MDIKVMLSNKDVDIYITNIYRPYYVTYRYLHCPTNGDVQQTFNL